MTRHDPIRKIALLSAVAAAFGLAACSPADDTRTAGVEHHSNIYSMKYIHILFFVYFETTVLKEYHQLPCIFIDYRV
jgi:hypothetical protein